MAREQMKIAGRDYVPEEWRKALDQYGKWKIVPVQREGGPKTLAQWEAALEAKGIPGLRFDSIVYDTRGKVDMVVGADVNDKFVFWNCLGEAKQALFMKNGHAMVASTEMIRKSFVELLVESDDFTVIEAKEYNLDIFDTL